MRRTIELANSPPLDALCESLVRGIYPSIIVAIHEAPRVRCISLRVTFRVRVVGVQFLTARSLLFNINSEISRCIFLANFDDVKNIYTQCSENVDYKCKGRKKCNKILIFQNFLIFSHRHLYVSHQTNRSKNYRSKLLQVQIYARAHAQEKIHLIYYMMKCRATRTHTHTRDN